MMTVRHGWNLMASGGVGGVMKRGLLLGGLVVALSGAFAAPAAGKGEVPIVGGVATILGPGLERPIVVRWRGDCLTYCPLRQQGQPFVRLVIGSGVVGFRGYGPSPAPDPDRLGPRYILRFEFLFRHGRVVRTHLAMYPYGPGDLPPYVITQPWFHVPPGQVGLGQFGAKAEPLDPGWFPGSPLLLDLLTRLGVPSEPPVEAAGPQSGAATATAAQSTDASLSVPVGVLALLAILLVVALALQRDRTRGS